MKNYLLPFLFFINSIQIYAQVTEFAVFRIADSLKENANAVVRYDLTKATIIAQNRLNVKNKSVVTVLNSKGNRTVDLYEHYNDDTTIKHLSVQILDAFGNEIKKFSKGKFTDISAFGSGTLYSDSRVKYVEFTPTSYPYTVVFESEKENSSTAFLPPWYPISDYSLSIEKSVFKINNPNGFKLRKKENNLEPFEVKNLSSGNNIHYELENKTAEKYEQSSLPYFDIAPSVRIALNDFTLKRISGTASNWKEFGKWFHEKLLTGITALDESTKSEIQNLVKDAETDVEKAKIVYDYVQDKTRYISVQVDIGGWQPITAREVDKSGYGDCKGLTNYTKALLDAVNVPSYHTIVYAKKRRDIDENFSAIQGNHMILNIPNGGNDIWLECTSQIHPFGFLGDFTDDRNVLVITPEGGEIKRTTAYKNETNLQTTKSNIIIDKEGKIRASVERVSKGIQYDDKFYINEKSKEDLEKYYKSEVWDYVNNLEIQNIDLDNNTDAIVFTEKLEVTIDDYIATVNNESLLKLNVFNQFSWIPKRYRNRKQPFEIERGFLDEDEFTFTLPDNLVIGTLPSPKKIETKFGSYSTTVEKLDEKTFRYKKSFLLIAGKHPKEEYANYRNFLKSITRQENLRIALQKK